MCEYICEFCSSNFKSKYMLTVHQKKTKYCLEKQGIYTTNFVCEFCDKNLSNNTRLKRHLQVCPNKHDYMEKLIIDYEKDNQQLKLEVDKLKSRLLKTKQECISLKKELEQFDRISKPRLEPLTTEYLDTQVQFITDECLTGDVNWYGKFAIEHSLKNRIGLKDTSRHKFYYINEKQQVIIDLGLVKVTAMFFASIKDKVLAIFDKHINELETDFKKSVNGKGDPKLTLMMLDVAKTRRKEIIMLSRGEGLGLDFYKKFILYILKHTI